ncbi:uncharacterized protein A1O9_12755, partial [Exophiala aquamarina CBS 119918]
LIARADACETNNEFLGPASNTAFMKHIRQVIEGHPLEDRASNSQSNRIDTHFSDGSPDYVLPPRQLADSLVDHYWNYVHPLYPFLHKQSFHETYEALWTGQKFPITTCTVMRTDEVTSVCILNLVLALGCQYHHEHGAGKARATAEVFYKRARSFLRLNPTEPSNNTLQLVQGMLLMTQFLMGTGHTHKAWGVVGMAVRTCYQLGLHRAADTGADTFPRPVQREIVRRVYHGALMLERLVCMNLGRPAMVSVSTLDSVSLPIETDDDDDLQSLQAAQSSKSLLSFFNHSARLYEIAQEILVSLYSGGNQTDSDGLDSYFLRDQSVFRLESYLRKWYAGIPSYLRLDPDALNVEGQMLANNSRLPNHRYLQVRIYLFRPIFVFVCTNSGKQCSNKHKKLEDDDPTGGLAFRTASQCSFLCVEAAIRLINVMHDNLTSRQAWGRKPSWLY